MKKTHWKKLDNPDYLGAYSLMDGETTELTATIEKVIVEGVKSDRGTENCKVAYLKGHKPMILNVTNCKVIQSIFDSPFIEDWKGKDITIYVDKVKAFGEVMDCLRIRKIDNNAILSDLKALFDKKGSELDASMQKRAKEIISNKESASYNKLINHLKTL